MTDKQSTDVLMKLELLPVTNCLPDFEVIKHNNVTTIIAVSEYGLQRQIWYAQVARNVAHVLDCDLMTFPGHHGSFLDLPAEFAATLRDVLRRADV